MSDSLTNGKATGERWAKLAARAVVDPALKPLDVRVLACIGIYAGREGTAWPSQQTIADMLGVERATVCRCIKRLRAAGYLERYRKRTPRGHLRNVYQLLYPAYVPLHVPAHCPEM
jgi:DNA-binding MarR family transcriptional regulator